MANIPERIWASVRVTGKHRLNVWSDGPGAEGDGNRGSTDVEYVLAGTVEERPGTWAWALRMMREGHSVRRSTWARDESARMSLALQASDTGRMEFVLYEEPDEPIRRDHGVRMHELAATDWDIVET